MKKLWDLYVKMPWERKILWSALGLALPPMLLAAFWPSSTPARETQATAVAPVDTFIPKGFVLVPIEVQNYESLDSVLGQFGLVDLFQSGHHSQTQQKLVARNVRILRAPQNPSRFAILVQEHEVAGILQNATPFFVVVKHPEKGGTEIVKEHLPSKRPIVYEGD